MRVITFSLRNLARKKSRTLLAILGITLGVMLITSLLMVMDGLEGSITESLSLLGGNLIIQEKGAIDQVFSIVNISLINDLQRLPDIQAISPEIYAPRNIEGAEGRKFVTLIGITPSYREIVSASYVKQGAFFNERGKIVLGSKLANQLNITLGDIFVVDTISFNVTGIFETNTGFADSIIGLIPLEDARSLRNMNQDQISIIEVRPQDPDKTEGIKAFVETQYSGYEVIYPADIVSEATEILGVLRTAVWIVSSIAVVIGGIGIANAMLMSVVERTPEIGLLKATGWKNSDVAYSVLIEAFTIGIVSGGLGICISLLIPPLATNINAALTVRLSLSTVIESFVFGVGLSLVSGIYPAVRASQVAPITAIRGE
jgi:putative ABC transport system permease protein